MTTKRKKRGAKFRVGQIVKHRVAGFYGKILGIDWPACVYACQQNGNVEYWHESRVRPLTKREAGR